MIFSHCTIYISCFSLTQSTCLQLRMPVDCHTEKRLLFWLFGLLYFHGKWISFCRDDKFSGTVLENKESKKYFNPQLNKPRIDFAAPSDKIKKAVQKKCKSTPFIEAWSYPLPFEPQMKQN